jgi:hypothetical protein
MVHFILVAQTDAEKAAARNLKFWLDRYMQVRATESNLLIEGDLLAGPHQTLDVAYNAGGGEGVADHLVINIE